MLNFFLNTFLSRYFALNSCKIVKFTIIILIVFLNKNTFAQNNKVDSLEAVINTNIDDTAKVKVYEKLAYAYSSISPEKSIKYLDKALKLSKNKLSDAHYINALIHASKLWRMSGNYEKSITYGFEALKISDSLDRKYDSAKALKYIGISYYRMKNFGKAIEYQYKALKIYFSKSDSVHIADCYTNIGVVYDETKKFDMAIFYYRKALSIYTNKNILSGMSDLYNNLAGIYYQKKDSKNVVKYINKSLDIKREMKDSVGISFILINIGGVYNQIGEYERGINSIKEGIIIAKKLNMFPIVSQGYRTLYEIYSDNKDYKKALKFHKLYAKTNDSLTNIKKVKNINEIQTKYETEKKNVEIKELKIEKIKNENTQKLFVIIILALIVVAILLIIFFVHRGRVNKVLNSNNEKLKQLNETQNRLMGIISHDFKAPLSAFYSITSSLKSKIDKISEKEIVEYLNRMLNSSIALKMQLENMLNWAINHSRRIKAEINNYNLNILIYKITAILQEFANEKNIKIRNNILESCEINTDGKLLGVVLNNLVSNAVKFSKPNSETIISSKKDNNSIIISVKDFGAGMKNSEAESLFTDNPQVQKNENSGTGLGLIVCKDIIKELGGKIWAKSEPGKGTEIFVKLNI